MSSKSRLLICVVTVILITSFGCSSGPRATSLQMAVDHYDAGRYAQAHGEAEQIMMRSSGTLKEDASYLAGLSAYQLGNIDEAERRFMFASQGSGRTATNAKVMLGQIRMDQDRPRDAAALFTETSQQLHGEDATQSALHAGIAFQEAGDDQSAKKWLSVAKSDGQSTLNAPIGFTLQVGAFRERTRAVRTANDVKRQTNSLALGETNIVRRRNSRGQTLYHVQVGSFATRQDAAAARSQIGHLEYIVVARANNST